MNVNAVSAVRSFGSITVPKRVSAPVKEAESIKVEAREDDVVSLNLSKDVVQEEQQVNAQQPKVTRPFLSLTSKAQPQHRYLFIGK